MELRRYQKDILNKLYLSLQKNKKVLLSLPTGAGKTIMMYHWAKTMADRGLKTMFIVDREELVDQVLSLDSTINVIKAGYKEKNPESLLQVVMLQTGYRREEQVLDIKPDFIFFDEIHNYINGRMFQTICDFCKNAKLIGVTATPIDPKGYLLEGFDDFICDLQTKDLIDMGYLVGPVYYTPSDYNLDLGMIRISNGDYNINDLDNVMINQNCADKIVDNYLKFAKGRQTIAFCSSIRQALYLSGYFKSKGINSMAVHSQSEHRTEIIKSFRDKKFDVLFNVGIAINGFDVPSVSCVIFANPTRILRRYLQQAGRGLRIAPGKEDCIMLDFADVVRQHGFCDDLRFYKKQPEQKDECTIKECPECGAIVNKTAQKCPYCNYEFTVQVEVGGGMRKKYLERLTRAWSMQEELKKKISELVDIKGYKTGYKWFLFLHCLENKKPTESSIQFFKRKINKINKIEKRGWKLAALAYD